MPKLRLRLPLPRQQQPQLHKSQSAQSVQFDLQEQPIYNLKISPFAITQIVLKSLEGSSSKIQSLVMKNNFSRKQFLVESSKSQPKQKQLLWIIRTSGSGVLSCIRYSAKVRAQRHFRIRGILPLIGPRTIRFPAAGVSRFIFHFLRLCLFLALIFHLVYLSHSMLNCLSKEIRLQPVCTEFKQEQMLELKLEWMPVRLYELLSSKVGSSLGEHLLD